MDYRVNSSVLDVIISGFFDSIGVYQQTPTAFKLKAEEWLARVNLAHMANKPFRTLSWGQQRRKLVKQFIEQLVENSQTQLLFVSHQDSDAPNCITHLFEFVPNEKGFGYLQKSVAKENK